MSYTTITSWALLIWRGLEHCGHDPAPLFAEAGLDPLKLSDPNARYPVERLAGVWERAAEVSEDACFGLSAAQAWHPTSWHALGFAWLASASLLDALHRLVRYLRVVSTMAAASVEEGTQYVELSLVPRVRTPFTHRGAPALHAALAVIVRLCRQSAGADFSPLEVAFMHPRPAGAERLESYFRAPIAFEATRNALVFDRAALDSPLPTANAELARANEQVVAAYLARLDRDDLLLRVRTTVVERLPGGEVTEEAIAEALHMSPRSLQRRLGEQGTTYRTLLEELRRDLAEHYLRDNRLSIGEITFLLGFAEPSVFSRAFKRWKGVPPSSYRGAQTG